MGGYGVGSIEPLFRVFAVMILLVVTLPLLFLGWAFMGNAIWHHTVKLWRWVLGDWWKKSP